MELELDGMGQEIDPNSGINIDSVKLSTFQWDIKCKIYITKLASNYFQKCHKFATRWSEAGWPGCSTRWRVRRSRWPTSVSTPSRGARRRTSPETVLSLHETWWDFLKCSFHARFHQNVESYYNDFRQSWSEWRLSWWSETGRSFIHWLSRWGNSSSC